MGLAEIAAEPGSEESDLSSPGQIADDSTDIDGNSDLAETAESAYADVPEAAPAAEPRAEASFSLRSGDSAAAVAPAPEPVAQQCIDLPAKLHPPPICRKHCEVVRQLDPPGVGLP